MKRTILLCLLFSFFFRLSAQIYNFREYGVDEGLPQSYVYSISQAPSGLINFSTGEGFCTFEGNRFHIFTVKDGLSDNFVTTHFTDSRNITWLGHYQKGLSFCSGDKFSILKQSASLEAKVTCITEDTHKNIWFAVQGNGVYKIDTQFRMQQEVIANEESVTVLCFDKSGRLLEGSDNGLYICGSGTTGKVLHLLQEVEGFSGKSIKAIVPCGAGRDEFWVAVNDEGIYGIKDRNGKYEVFLKIDKALGLKDHTYTSLYVDHRNNLWAGDFGEGVRKISFYDVADRRYYTVSHIDSRNGLPNEYIQSICEDYEGNMWFGSFGGGLIELPQEKFSFFETRNGLSHKNITAMLIGREGNFWLGNDKGLYRYNMEESVQNKFFDASNGFANAEVTALGEDRQGKIWIGTKEKGVFILDKEKETFLNFSEKHALSSLGINSIIVTSENKVVIATTSGVYFYDPERNTIRQLTTLDGLLHNNVSQVFEDSKKRIWFCSEGAGPYFMEKNEFNIFNNIPELRSYSISAVTQAPDGTIWIGTDGDGVFSYTEKGGFINYRTSEGLLSNYCYFMMTDKTGNVWCGHKNGLSCKAVNSKTFRTYSKTDGLLFTDFNRYSCYRDVSGNLWFGTSNGMIKFNSECNEKLPPEPKISIAGVTLNRSFFSGEQPIEVPYDDYAVKVDYQAISFTDPSKVSYRYRLLGLDTVWRTTNSQQMEFPKLNDGEYVFQLVASNSDKIWNHAPAEVSFVVKPPYWKKAWFYLLLLLMTISLSYSATSYRTRSLVQAKQQLENKVMEKTELLQEEKATVEKIKAQLEVKNKNVTDSINYAQRIQASILPTVSSIKNTFRDSFVYYRPRDIVSGDFYWFLETPDSYLVAAVDCTGHGVPGAFMSLVGSTLLSGLAANKQITRPSTILRKLNSSIIKVLRQKADYNSSHDGMDMALCAISKKKDKLIFSGALRPLYHFRNKELTELKGNPYFIGGYYDNLEKTFRDEELDLLPGDTIYIFSDGYGDQFSASTKKRFSTKRFKVLLGEISDKPMEEQYALLHETFVSWSAGEDQMDDVLVIGIRF